MRRAVRTATVTVAVVCLWSLATACTGSASPTSGARPSTTVALTPTRPVAPVTTMPATPVSTVGQPNSAPAVPGYEVAGVPAGWVRAVDRMEPHSYRILYVEPVPSSDRLASIEADGRRISLVVTADPDGATRTVTDSYPGHAATVAGMPATVVETAPPPGGRRGVAWRAHGVVFEVYAYMDEPALLRLAATVAPTGRPPER